MYAKWTKVPTIEEFDGITITPDGPGSEIKSGYGIGCEVNLKVEDLSDLTQLTVKARNTATGNVFDMELVPGTNKWVLPVNLSSKTNARVDYLPVELPDGNYQFDIVISYDGRELGRDVVSYTVKGVMYEDDFTGDRN